MRWKSISSKETRSIARLLASETIKCKGKRALIIALRGNLGSGKTVFAKGFLRALGVKVPATSPTFTLIKRYRLPRSKRTVFHVDAYRIESPKELGPLNFRKLLHDPRNVVLVEWPERIAGALPEKKLTVRFAHGKKSNERIISY